MCSCVGSASGHKFDGRNIKNVFDLVRCPHKLKGHVFTGVFSIREVSSAPPASTQINKKLPKHIAYTINCVFNILMQMFLAMLHSIYCQSWIYCATRKA